MCCDHLVVKVNVFIADMKDFSAMNEVYTQYWGENKPSRTYVKFFPPRRIPRANIEETAALLSSNSPWEPTWRSNALRSSRKKDQHVPPMTDASCALKTDFVGIVEKARRVDFEKQVSVVDIDSYATPLSQPPRYAG